MDYGLDMRFGGTSWFDLMHFMSSFVGGYMFLHVVGRADTEYKM